MGQSAHLLFFWTSLLTTASSSAQNNFKALEAVLFALKVAPLQKTGTHGMLLTTIDFNSILTTLYFSLFHYFCKYSVVAFSNQHNC